MRICVISDLHGNLIPNIEPCELVLICGDVSPLTYQRSKPSIDGWLKKRFSKWINDLPCEKVFMVAGNHDLCFENRAYDWKTEYIINPTNETLNNKMPENCDILISHDAPYGTNDVCFEGWNRDHLGCEPLRKIVLEKEPTYMFHGHLHTSNHELEMLDKTKVYNTSILNERYKITFKPLYLNV